MTRINLVDPSELSNKHLLAEYKEITRPFTKVWRRMEKNRLDFQVPERYVLGAGHETFFFDKLLWLYNRYEKVAIECLNRKININWDSFVEIRSEIHGRLGGTQFWNDYKPTPEEIYLNMARLCVRSNDELVYKELSS